LVGSKLLKNRDWANGTGSIILDGIGILIALVLILRSQRKRAAVGRRSAKILFFAQAGLTLPREMQLFLLGYILIDICEIFTIGGFPLKNSVRIVRTRSKFQSVG